MWPYIDLAHSQESCATCIATWSIFFTTFYNSIPARILTVTIMKSIETCRRIFWESQEVFYMKFNNSFGDWIHL